MNKESWIILAVVMAMLGGSAIFLGRVQSGQRLGEPGVLIVNEPIYDPEGKEAGAYSVKLPENLPGYESKPEPVTEMELSWLPKDTTFGKRMYKGEDEFVSWLSVVVMGTDRGSIHKPQICLVGQGWKIEQTEEAAIPMKRPHPYELPVMKLTTSMHGKGADGEPVHLAGVYVYWFVADGQLTPHHGERMWWMARDIIVDRVLQRWAYIAFFSICWPGEEEATFERMKDLISLAVPEFQLTHGLRLAQAEAGE